jgi:hypothetical protein
MRQAVNIARSTHRVAGVRLQGRHEAWFIELLSKERGGKGIPSGHFRRVERRDAPCSSASFYSP